MNGCILSIIIPVYNSGSFLRGCLDSVFNALGMLPDDVTDEIENKVEIIAVDDGSTDDSYLILMEYQTGHSILKVFHQSNGGTAYARKIAMNNSSGAYLWFIDADDRLTNDAVVFMLKLFERTPDKDIVDVFIFDAFEIKNGKRFLWDHFDRNKVFAEQESIRMLQRGALYSREIGSRIPFAAPWDKVYRRRFLNDNGIEFREELRVLDDMFFNMEAFGAAKRVEYIKHPVYNYVRNDAGITASYTPGRAKKDMVVWMAIEKYIESIRAIKMTDNRTGNETGSYNIDRMDDRKCNMSNQAYSEEEIRKLENAFHKRILKSYAICCKLDIFNRKRHTSISKRIAYAAKLARNEHYRNAFRVSFYEIEPLLWTFLLFGKIVNLGK